VSLGALSSREPPTDSRSNKHAFFSLRASRDHNPLSSRLYPESALFSTEIQPPVKLMILNQPEWSSVKRARQRHHQWGNIQYDSSSV